MPKTKSSAKKSDANGDKERNGALEKGSEKISKDGMLKSLWTDLWETPESMEKEAALERYKEADEELREKRLSQGSIHNEESVSFL